MLESILKAFDNLPPIHGRKNESLAAALAFFFGGIGLGIYLRSFIDFILPVAVGILSIYWLGDVGWLGGAIIASVYAYFRVLNSNSRQVSAEQPALGANQP